MLDKQIKTVRIFHSIFGGIICIYCLMNILRAIVSVLFYNTFLDSIHFIFIIIFLLIGMTFLGLGLYFHKIKRIKFTIHLVTSIFLIALMLIYFFIVNEKSDSWVEKMNSEIQNNVHTMMPIMRTIAFIHIVLVVLTLSIIVGKKLKNIEKQINAT